MTAQVPKLICIAQQGSRRFILVPEGVDNNTDQARVVDLDQGRLFKPWYLQSILARGYWADYEGTPTVDELLAQVKVDAP